MNSNIIKSNQEFKPISMPLNILIAEDDGTDRLLFDETPDVLPVTRA